MDAKRGFVPAVRLSTDPRGRKSILLVGLKIEVNFDNLWARLLVGFDHWEWDIEIDGLLRGNQHFLQELKDLLCSKGYDARELSYADNSLQGLNYVCFDAGPKFVKSWAATAA